MKTILKLVAVVAMFTYALTADAQFRKADIDTLVKLVNMSVEKGGLTADQFTPLMDTRPEARDLWQKTYTTPKHLEFKNVILMTATNSKEGVARRVVGDTNMWVRELLVKKLTGKKEHEGVRVALWAYDPNQDDQRLHIFGTGSAEEGEQVVGLEKDGAGDGRHADKPVDTPSFQIIEMDVNKDGVMENYIMTIDANTGMPEFTPIANLIVASPNAPSQEGDGEKQGGKAPATPKKGAAKNADETVDGTEKPPVSRTATVSKTVSQEGDPDLIAQLENGGGQATGGSKSADEDSGYKVVTVNGVERLLLRNPDGTYSSADENGDLAKITLNGKDFVLSEGQAEASGVKNAYKHGMRDASGYRNNYYRNARNGHPLNSTVVVNNGGGYPVQSGGYYQNGIWMGGGVNVGYGRVFPCKTLPPQLNCSNTWTTNNIGGAYSTPNPNQITLRCY